MNPWIAIIAKYGFDAAIELAKIIQDKTDPSPDDFKALKLKYGSKTANDYLIEAGVPIPPTP